MKFVLYEVSKVPTFPLMSNKKLETRKMFQKLISGSAEKGKARSQGSTSKVSKKAKSTQGTPGPADERRPSTSIEKETETPRKRLRSPGFVFESSFDTPAWRQSEETSGIFENLL